MLGILFTTVAFLVAISILIAIHEFGHFWVAKKAGVKILRYSIGFGKPLFIKRFGEDKTEFVIASLPLGGYVKMLDEREGEVPASESHRAFNNQSIKKRFAIVFAGPLFNFIFAVFAYWMMFVIGVDGIKPIVGEVTVNSPAAQAGLTSGLEILEIEGKPVPIWDVALETLLPVMVDHGSAQMKLLGDQGYEFETTLDLQNTDKELEPGNMFEILGFKPFQPVIKPIAGRIVEGLPADQAGLLEGDEIIEIEGESVASWQQLVVLVSQRPDQLIKLVVLRNGQKIDFSVRTLEIDREGVKVGQLGIGPFISQDNAVTYRYGVFESVIKSLENTWNNSALTLKMLGKMITGEVSIKNISGPLNIAVYAGHSASAGPARFLNFLAIVSISLGILNLLPIPILDGGHLMFYLVEAIKGKPVSEQTELIGQQIGIAALVLLMSLALYNDVIRFFN